MKQGILILAHKNFDQLYHLVNYFSKDCYVFIHLDKKSDFNQVQINQLKNKDQVKGVYKKYSVHWAGFSILKSELFLLKESYYLVSLEILSKQLAAAPHHKHIYIKNIPILLVL